MAESTTRKVCSRAKTMFNATVEKRLLRESPFASMKKLAIEDAKKFYVTREMADKVPPRTEPIYELWHESANS